MSRNNGNGNAGPVRVVLVDDHPIVLEGFRMLAAQKHDIDCVGAAEDVESALLTIERERPDVVVTELTLSGPGGFGLIRAVRSRNEGARVVVLTGLDQGTYVQRALQAGAHGFVSKSEATEDVFDAIRSVHEGETFVSKGLVDAVGIDPSLARDEDDPLARLSNRELEVFRLIGEGRSTREIARLLERSIKTVEAHREHIKQKLGLRDGSALLQRAIQWVWEQNTPANGTGAHA